MVMVPIVERGLKVRIASSHPAYVAHFSRCLSKHLLPFLKELKWSRSSLRNEPIELQSRHRSARLFSADLSAASDWIDHAVGQAVLKGLLEGLGASVADIEGAMRCLEPFVLDGELTTRGAHMGLGTTWTVLSLLNAFAAYQASSNKDSSRICGDDLIGLWTPREQHIYVRWIERLGLKINEKKSFRGVRGVFCEKLVWIDSIGSGGVTASQSQHCTTLKEVYSEEAIVTSKTDPINVERVQKIARDRSEPWAMRTLAKERLSSFRIAKGVPEGPAGMGGSGRGKVSLKGVKDKIKSFLLKGPFSLPGKALTTESFQDRMENYRNERTSNPEKGIPYRDVLTTEMRAEYELAINSKFTSPEKIFQAYTMAKEAPGEVKKEERRKDGSKYKLTNAIRRWTRGTRSTEMSEAIRNSQWINSRTRSRLLRLSADKKHKDNPATWRGKITTLLTRTPVQFVPQSVLAQHPTRPNGSDQNGCPLSPRWQKKGPNA